MARLALPRFSLIELLVVGAVILAIATFATPTPMSANGELEAMPAGFRFGSVSPIRLKYDVPGSIKLGDTPTVSITIEALNQPLWRQVSAQMTSAGLTVNPTSTQTGTGEVVRFNWTVGAAQAGDTDVIVQFKGITIPSTQLAFLRNRGRPLYQVGEELLVFKIQVTNRLGLTATQVTIFQAVGSLVGLLGGGAVLKALVERLLAKRQNKHLDFE